MPNLLLVARLSAGWAGQMENDMKSRKFEKLMTVLIFLAFLGSTLMAMDTGKLMSWLYAIGIGFLLVLYIYIYRTMPRETKVDEDSL